MIELLRPWALLLLPLPIVAWWMLPVLAANAALPVPQSVRGLMLGLSSDGGRRRQVWPEDIGLKALGWLALIIALAGPQTSEASLLKPTGRDLIVAVDLSASMDEQDMEIDGEMVPRYLAVRQIVGAFIRARRGDRVGLIAFGHEAYLVAPLTFDIQAVSTLLEELQLGLPGHRTDVGRAIGLTIQTFKSQAKARRVLVLLSDGEDNTGELTGADAADLAAAQDIRIHTIAFSTEPEADGAEVLRHIAEHTGGLHFWARSAEALAVISKDIDRVEPVAQEADEDHVKRDWSFVAVGLAILALAGLVVQALRRS